MERRSCLLHTSIRHKVNMNQLVSSSALRCYKYRVGARVLELAPGPPTATVPYGEGAGGGLPPYARRDRSPTRPGEDKRQPRREGECDGGTDGVFYRP